MRADDGNGEKGERIRENGGLLSYSQIREGKK